MNDLILILVILIIGIAIGVVLTCITAILLLPH